MITKVRTVINGPEQLAIVFPSQVTLTSIEEMHNAVRELLRMVVGSEQVANLQPTVGCCAMELMQYLSPSDFSTISLSNFKDPEIL